MLKDIDFNEILKKGTVFTIFRGCAFLFGYVFSWITIRYYGSDIYGLVTLSFTVMVIVSVLTRYGLDINLTKVFGIENSYESCDHYKVGLIVSLSLSILISFPLYIFSSSISDFVFSKPEFAIYLKWTSFSIPLWTFLLINIGVFRGLRQVFYYSTLDNFGRFLLSIIILLVFIQLDSNHSAEQPIISHTIALFILLLISFIVVKNKIAFRFSLDLSKSKTFLLSSFPIMITTSIVIVLAWADKIFLGIFDSNENIGVYDICVRIAGLLTFSLEGINAILSPKISSYYKKQEYQDLNRIVQFGSKVNIILALFILVWILVFSDEILLLFGQEFLEGKIALMILLMGQLVNSYCGPVGNILMMTGHQIPFRNIMIATLMLNMIFNLLLIPTYSILGAAISTSLSLILWNIAGAYYLKNRLQISSYYTPKFLKTK